MTSDGFFKRILRIWERVELVQTNLLQNGTEGYAPESYGLQNEAPFYVSGSGAVASSVSRRQLEIKICVIFSKICLNCVENRMCRFLDFRDLPTHTHQNSSFCSGSSLLLSSHHLFSTRSPSSRSARGRFLDWTFVTPGDKSAA